MVISRTPYRISFFGGGTDYPIWYKENGGAVLGTTIDRYCYITCRYLPPFFPHKHRIVWSRIENVREISQIRHPAVKAAMNYLEVCNGIELHHDGDLPARSGLGTSSAFMVGILHALNALNGNVVTKSQLAKSAVYLEQEVLKENVGSQDQVLTAFGGLNRVSFFRDGKLKVQPIKISTERRRDLESHLVLLFTGLTRYASKIASEQIKNTPQKKSELTAMHEMVDEGIKILCSHHSLLDFGKLLDEAWKIKRSLSGSISNPQIDDLYQRAKKAGAVGGKLLGAGGGGFLLLCVRPEDQKKLREILKSNLFVPFTLESTGSKIIYNEVI